MSYSTTAGHIVASEQMGSRSRRTPSGHIVATELVAVNCARRCSHILQVLQSVRDKDAADSRRRQELVRWQEFVPWLYTYHKAGSYRSSPWAHPEAPSTCQDITGTPSSLRSPSRRRLCPFQRRLMLLPVCSTSVSEEAMAQTASAG